MVRGEGYMCLERKLVRGEGVNVRSAVKLSTN